ncbi:MAG: phosphoribosyltransferase [Terrimonas sp.]|nr:phosphoribosyltransferase [Terrimonas sp.]
MTTARNYILDQETAEKKLLRMAYEILENNADEPAIIFAGIRERGKSIARRIQQLFSTISTIPTSVISVQLDKDMPDEVKLSEEMNFDDKVIILIDDVASSGKTLVYALKPFIHDHPRKIQTLVLVERSHKTFPVHPDYVGLSLATTLQDHIFVEVEGDTVKGAYLE